MELFVALLTLDAGKLDAAALELAGGALELDGAMLELADLPPPLPPQAVSKLIARPRLAGSSTFLMIIMVPLLSLAGNTPVRGC